MSAVLWHQHVCQLLGPLPHPTALPAVVIPSQLPPIPSSGLGARPGSPGGVPSAPATKTAGLAGGHVGPEPSLAGLFRTPEMPMLGVALFSPNTQVRGELLFVQGAAHGSCNGAQGCAGLCFRAPLPASVEAPDALLSHPPASTCPDTHRPSLPLPVNRLQSQLDFSGGLGGDLLLEMGAATDPLGLLSPALLTRHQQVPAPNHVQAAPLRPGSGLSSVRPGSLMHGGSAGKASRTFATTYAAQAPAASSVPGRRVSEVGEASFLRSPGIGGTPRVPALFKSPEEQRAAAPQSATLATQTQHQEQRRPSFFSPATLSVPSYRGGASSPTTAAAAASIARSSSQPAGAAAAAAAAAGGSGGRNLVTVQSGRLESLDCYLAEVGLQGQGLWMWGNCVHVALCTDGSGLHMLPPAPAQPSTSPRPAPCSCTAPGRRWQLTPALCPAWARSLRCRRRSRRRRACVPGWLKSCTASVTAFVGSRVARRGWEIC